MFYCTILIIKLFSALETQCNTSFFSVFVLRDFEQKIWFRSVERNVCAIFEEFGLCLRSAGVWDPFQEHRRCFRGCCWCCWWLLVGLGMEGQDPVLSEAVSVAPPSAAEWGEMMKDSGPATRSSVIDYATDVQASRLERDRPRGSCS